MNPSVLGFRKTPVAMISMDESWQVVSRFPVESVLSHSDENFRRGNPVVFCFFSGIEKIFVRGGGEYQNFPSTVVCLTVPKYFVVEAFCAVFQKVAGSEKVYG